MTSARATILIATMLWGMSTAVLAQDSVFLDQLAWMEVRDAIRAGKTTVIIPTGGTEQNGPHMVLGKHNVRVTLTAGEIARRLGNALIAPTMAYAPEGNIDPPSGHMRFPGTITLPPEHFAQVVEFAARSLKVAGFTDILLIGDSGPNQAPQKQVAEMLNREWATTPTRVHHLDKYYSGTGFDAWLEMTQGLGDIVSTPCPWLQYADYEMDPIWRSQNGAITPVTEWSLYGDHGMDPIRRSVTPA